jgi:histidyl-tRNA synthetase
MTEKKIQPVRGTRDIRGEEILHTNHIIEVARHLSALYNYEELSTPIFEFSEVFHRSIGETSDIVNKETYTFSDRDGKSITLRPEFTAGVVRSFISEGLTQSVPVKLFSVGPLFRYERPQRGRYRQFSQINFEYLGAKGERADVETISLASEILNNIGLKEDIILELNSIGDNESRQRYRETLIKFLDKFKNELSNDSKMRLEKNPLRILDSKDEIDQKILSDAPNIIDSLSSEAASYYSTIKDNLAKLDIEFIENPKLVRGLDYYTHTVFEFITKLLRSQGTIMAGGRYDGLVELMGGPYIPAIGFAIGLERLVDLLKEKKILLNKNEKISLIPIGKRAQDFSIILAYKLRQKGKCIDNEIYDNIGKMMSRANKIQARHAIIFGDEELNNNLVKIKDMETGDEKTVKLEEIL